MKQANRYPITLLFLGVLFFLPFLGNVHLFDWDEINFAESAREMIVTNDYQRVKINFEPFWEKPPFFFWMQVVSMKLFGINEFAARFPNALIGIITLLVLYKLGKKLYSPTFGFIWALIYLGSLLPHIYFKSAIIDPTFNFFIFCAVYHLCFWLTSFTARLQHTVLSALFLGLAIITKGPVAFLLLFLTFLIYLFFKKVKIKLSAKEILIFSTTVLLVTALWFGYEVYKNGIWFLVKFIAYQIELFTKPVAGHEQPFYYHFVVVLIGCFPMSLFLFPHFKKNNAITNQPHFNMMMKILFWVVLILFSISKTKIVHYSSLSYFPLSFLAAEYLYYLQQHKTVFPKFIKIGYYILGSIFSILLITVPYLFYRKDWAAQLFSKDELALASLNFDLQFQGWEFLIGFIFLASLLISLSFYKKAKIVNAVLTQALGLGLCLLAYSEFVIPKIERFSQGPVILFLKEKAKEDCYITVLGHKSYAHYFYGNIKPFEKNTVLYQKRESYINNLKNKNNFDFFELSDQLTGSLINDKLDKKVYFIAKLTTRENIAKQHPQLQLIKSQGMFDFYERNP